MVGFATSLRRRDALGAGHVRRASRRCRAAGIGRQASRRRAHPQPGVPARDAVVVGRPAGGAPLPARRLHDAPADVPARHRRPHGDPGRRRQQGARGDGGRRRPDGLRRPPAARRGPRSRSRVHAADPAPVRLRHDAPGRATPTLGAGRATGAARRHQPSHRRPPAVDGRWPTVPPRRPSATSRRANAWAVDVGLAARLDLHQEGYLALRGHATRRAPYLHHGTML